MKNKNVKIGMKVVPFQKTAYGYRDLDASAVWKRAKKNNQPFLYVIEWDYDTECWMLHENKDSTTGDYFNSYDFEPYKEQIVGKIVVEKLDEEYEIGLRTSLTDINGEPLHTGDIVSLEGYENSIVCTERGDIMGIWGNKNGVEEYQIKKIKSYTQLEDGEVYRNCMKIVLNKNKKESKIVKESKLQKELRKVEARAKELRAEIQKQEHEKTICEGIGMYSVDRTENMKGEQYISRDKLRLKLHDSKNSEYTVTYRREGYKTICEFSSGDIVGEGVAKCNPDDEFDYFTGIRIAELRARSDFYKKIADKVASSN